MLDKSVQPSLSEIKNWLGAESYMRLKAFEELLESNYSLSSEIKFPFGNSYGWGYKLSHKKSHLCYAFFEKGSFAVTLQLGDKLFGAVEEIMPSLLPKTQELWKNRYPCGERGGWIHYQVLSDAELVDISKLVFIKKKPQAISS